MSITVAEKLHSAPAGEFSPMVPRAVADALNPTPAALALWVRAQSMPEGWEMGNREQIAAAMNWTAYRVREAIRALRAAGLYVVERIQDAAGRWLTACRFVASAVSAQVTPKVDLPGVGKPAGIPPFREKKREGRTDHDPATCQREAAGKPCRQCAKVYDREKRAAETSSAATIPASHPAYRPVGQVLGYPTHAAVEDGEPWSPPVVEPCRHGRIHCVACITGKDELSKVERARAH